MQIAKIFQWHGVNSLEELAYNLNTEGYICSLIDAGHENVYAGFFEIKKDENNLFKTTQSKLSFLNLKDENGKLELNNLIDFLPEKLDKKTIYFVGDATIIYEELIKKLDKKYIIKLSNHKQNIASGITLARLGYIKYKNGEYGDSSVLSPVYLRKSQAELALEDKK